MKNAVTLEARFPTDQELKNLFGSVNTLHQYRVFDKAMGAGAKVLDARASQLAPRSTEKDRKKRSKKQAAQADWTSVPLNTTIDYVIRQGDFGGLAVVGPAWPHGNKAYFNQPRSGSRKQVLWGKMTRLAPYIAQRNWMVQAFDESRDAILTAMKNSIRKHLDEVMRG